MSILSRWRRKRLLRSAGRRIRRNSARLAGLSPEDMIMLHRARPDLSMDEAVGLERLTDGERAACQDLLRSDGRHAEAAMMARMFEIEDESIRTRRPTEEDVEECEALATAFVNRMGGSR